MQVSDIIQLLSICSRTCIFFTAELCVIPALVEIFPVAETKFLPACSSFSPGSKSLQIFPCCMNSSQGISVLHTAMAL